MGLDELESLIEKSNFPWLLSNVFDADTEKPLLNVQTKCIVEIDGIKVMKNDMNYYKLCRN